MKYLLDEIQEFANKIADDIITFIVVKDAEEAIVDAAIKSENEGAPLLTIDVLANGAGLAAIVPNALNILPISFPLAKVAQVFSVGQISQAGADNEYTWEDYAALSTAIGNTLLTFPGTAPPASLFLLLGATTPALNNLGRELGGAIFHAINSDTNTLFLQLKSWTPPRRDPLALDLDNDGIETIGISGTVVVFDHDGDGIKTGTGWVFSDDGFLVLDRNDNGTIDTGAELFGVDTVKADGSLAVDGFDALSDLDANADGIFDASDDAFGTVQVWQDFNQDGVSTANELSSLSDLGVISINLNADSNNVNLGNGNVQTAAAAHLTVDGEGETGNLDLANNPFYREFVDTIPFTEEALSLPDSKGSGMVRDLREAVSLSPTLASALTNYVSQTNYAGQRAQLDDVLTAWADTSSMVTSVEQAADNGYFLFYLKPGQSWADYDQHLDYWNTTDTSILDALSPEVRESYDALQLQQQELVGVVKVLEKFNATTLVEVGADRVTLGNGGQNMVSPAPGSADIDRVFVSVSTQRMEFMQQSYASLKESVYSSLITQTRLSDYLNGVTLNVSENVGVFLDFSALNTLLDDQKATNPGAALADLIEIYKYNGELLQENGWTGLDILRSWIDAGIGGAEAKGILKDLGVSIVEKDGDDVVVFSGSGNTALNGSSGDDILNGGTGNDTLGGYSGNDILNGGSGRDLLIGGDGDDILRGGTGENDHLKGDGGNDIYLFAAGDGATSINNSDADTNSHDILRFMAGISPDDVTAKRDAHNLHLTIKTTGEVITVTNYFFENETSTYVLDAIEFNDGTNWDLAVLKQMVMQTTVGNDNIIGFDSNDVIDGLSGDDILSGAAGHDTLNGDEGNDIINGGEGNDTLTGGSGNDTLHGVNGDDILDGGDGRDTVFGGAGDDTLSGGIGTHDYLAGDAGNDTYLFAAGDGNTRIDNYDVGVDRQDILHFQLGITPDDIRVTRSNSDLKLTLQSTGEVITNSSFFWSSSYELNAVEFTDGTIWDVDTIRILAITGSDGADTITGYASNDTIDGLGGNDTVYGMDGNDTLSGGQGNWA